MFLPKPELFTMPTPCFKCNETVISDDILKCNGECQKVFHFQCVNMRPETFRKTSNQWKCLPCREKLSVKQKDPKDSGSEKEDIEEELDIKTMFKKIMEGVKIINVVNNKLDGVIARVDELESKVEMLENEKDEWKAKVEDLESRLVELEQRSRICNIEISGIPVTPNEDCRLIVLDVAKAAGMRLQNYMTYMSLIEYLTETTDKNPLLLNFHLD